MEKIGISTENFAGNTLYVNDYKLAVLGSAADFEVYDAATGIIVKDATAARDTDTAYRLSWLNATSGTKVYNIVANYTDGTKEIVETIVMKPGCDGVNTAIVKANGKAFTLTTEEVEGADPDAPIHGDPGNQGGTNQGTNQGGLLGGLLGGDANADYSAYVGLMITVIVLSVVLIGAVTASLLITGKHEKKPSDEEEAIEADAENDT